MRSLTVERCASIQRFVHATLARLTVCATVVLTLSALPSAAQVGPRTDVIRGRVTGPDTVPVLGAQVVAVDTVSKVQRPTRTDARGAFAIAFENGNGTYMVGVNMLGFAPQRRVVSRLPDGSMPVVEFKLSQVAAQLGAVRSVGERPRAVRSDVGGDFSVGGQTSFVNPNNGLTGDLTGDLTLALTTIPGVTLIPSATGGLPTVSAFGITGDQNGMILNGMGFGGNVPRDGFRVGVVTSSYDPSRGGFAGIQTTLRMQAGTNLLQRSIHTTLDAPAFQWTTPVASQLATRYGQQIFSGTLSGPIVLDHVFYSTAFQFQRRASGLTSLASADPASLEALRISPDSVERLFAALSPVGIPVRTPGVPSARQNTDARLAARIDWVPHPAPSPAPGIIFGGQNATQDAYYLQAGGTLRNNDGAMIGPTSVPSFGGEQAHRDGWAQFTSAKYLPKSILNETTVSLSASTDRSAPYLDLPAARILVASSLANGDAGLATLQVGGNSQPRSNSRNWQTEVRNQASWNTWDRRHSISVTLSGAEEGYSITQDAGFGSFAFNSLADFTNAMPASYSRTLTGRSSSGRAFTGAFGIGDTYVTRNPTAQANFGPTAPPLTIQYGIRVEGNHFSVRPSYNSQVDSVFGLRTDHVPSTIAVMPMLGFRASFLQPPRSATGLFFGPRLNVSGGIREYRGTIAARTIDTYSRQTGLPDAIRNLYCVGSATPAPDWRGFESSSAAVPTQCANGTTGSSLSQSTPPVALFAPDYALFESWRPQLNASYQLSQSYGLSLTSTYTVNRNMPGNFDANFRARQSFTLPAEGGRPVYVSASSIVPGSGAVAWTESRVSPLFAHVAESRSDLRSETRTLGGTLNYFTFLLQPGNTWNASVSYTYSDSREQFRGFAGTTAGDPTSVAWSRGTQARHVVTMNVGRRVERLGSATLFGRIQSGQPYTPLVIGDINGDGYSNDRAYIFRPGAPNIDAALSADMSQLLARAPSGARSCLSRQLGSVAGRNSCVGPWAFSNLSLQLTPDPYRFHMGNRGSVSLFVNNILSGLDQALHGSSKVHGWGQAAFPDPALLTVRGYDPTSQQFKYAVNPQFGSTAVFRNTFRQPFMLTIDFRMDVAPDRESQFLESLLTPRKTDHVDQLTEAQIKQRIMRGNNPVDQIILVKDSLKLTDTQVDSMRKLGQRFVYVRDSIAGDVARFLSRRHGDYGADVRRVWHSAGIASFTVFFRTMRSVIDLFTPEQDAQSQRVPQTAGLLLQIRSLKESDLPWLFRSPLSSLP
jgi:hypothetical protein